MIKNKILYVASSTSHIDNFHTEYIRTLRACSFEIHTAAGGIDGINFLDKHYNLPFEKNKNLFKNITVILRLAKIINRKQYDIISTQSTLAGFVGRFAVLFNKNVKVFHTCHGYLFNDDGSLKSKIMIFIERVLSCRTDILFVMNHDDYAIAKKYKLCNNIKYINGMGLNPAKLAVTTETDIIEKYKIPKHKKYLLCVGEFSKRKSQRDIIYALKLIKNISDLHIIFLGDGVLLDECQKLCETLELSDSVTFCGHVSKTGAFYELADCVISASRFEGMPFNIMEAMHFKKSVIASNVKGHKDLIEDDFNGYLFDYGNSAKIAESIEKILVDENYNRLKSNAYLDEKYLLENIKDEILEEYKNC